MLPAKVSSMLRFFFDAILQKQYEVFATSNAQHECGSANTLHEGGSAKPLHEGGSANTLQEGGSANTLHESGSANPEVSTLICSVQGVSGGVSGIRGAQQENCKCQTVPSYSHRN